MNEMQQRHKQERDDLNKAKDEEIGQFKQFWSEKMDHFDKTSKEQEEQMQARHKQEQEKTK